MIRRRTDIPQTEFGRMLLAAIDECGRARGERQTDRRRATLSRREVAVMAGIDQSVVTGAIWGRSHPERRTVERLARALAPFLDRDRALVAAGYMPPEEKLRSIMGLLLECGADAIEDVERRLVQHWLPTPADINANGKADTGKRHHLGKDEADG